ncbi:flagellar assembly protein T N-terminal domain-containing protein [Gilvimarinus polysaccharolyticus]|uniref:flagellar assembly protein T N-terminal domain-containing protein n=1 Tax=Gilvimarinus polysaccharolyticus TaxID=863921 RepID=UPI0006737557|nr:flagellar assembly protein T N-terminal domain-containing protein [Gilvimarinus polysaccharolyticus]
MTWSKMLRSMLLTTQLVILLGGWQFAYGDVISAEGRSPLGSDIQAARQSAYEDAIRNALIKFGSQVNSLTDVNNGVLVSDRVNLRALGKVSDVEVLDERQHNGIYVVAIKAVVSDEQDCSSPNRLHYNKNVLLTGFPRARPESSRVGQLHNIDTDFSAELSQRLYPAYNVLVQDEPSVVLSNQTRYESSNFQTSDTVKNLAKKYQVQLVVSGSILDMSMLYPDDYFRKTHATRFSQSLSDFFSSKSTDEVKEDVRARHFAFRMVVHDGISGSPIFDKSYSDIGIWSANYTEETGFGTPRFWKTAYGAMVNSLIENAINDLGEKINCQPFMVPAQPSDTDNSVYLFAGANHGIKVGDTLDINNQSGGYLPSLSNTSYAGPYPPDYKTLQAERATLTVTQVYPTYSVGVSSDILTKGVRYLAISW